MSRYIEYAYLVWDGAYEEKDVIAVAKSLETAMLFAPKTHEHVWSELGEDTYIYCGVNTCDAMIEVQQLLD
jgi:hypothetical protein